jgi:DNA polymerase-1
MANKKELLKMVEDLGENSPQPQQVDKILLVDGMNLFFRNFAMLNMVNPNGAHIGGLGGFFRSLGALIKNIEPDEIYLVFDGKGSSNNRKNLIPEYKSTRNQQRITNWEIFEDYSEENDAKIDQIVRIIQYLKTLPVKVLSIDKTEADDIIAYLGDVLSDKNTRTFMVSSDKDFIQLIDYYKVLYRPMEKEFYTKDFMISKYGFPPENFIIYKLLMGDSSDNIRGVKGLGPKKFYKLFPQIKTEHISLNKLYEICEENLDKHVIYARILQDKERLEKNYKIMDLSNPLLSSEDKQYIDSFIKSSSPDFFPESFLEMYHKDQLGGIIRNVEFWVEDVFRKFTKK